MHAVHFCRLPLAVGCAALAMFAGVAPTSAQDRNEIEVVPQIPHSRDVRSVAFSPDGAGVLSRSDDNTIKLWDAASGRLIRTFEGHSGRVHSVAFSPDGRRIVSGSDDTTIRVWDAQTGEQFAILIGARDGDGLR